MFVLFPRLSLEGIVVYSVSSESAAAARDYSVSYTSDYMILSGGRRCPRVPRRGRRHAAAATQRARSEIFKLSPSGTV